MRAFFEARFTSKPTARAVAAARARQLGQLARNLARLRENWVGLAVAKLATTTHTPHTHSATTKRPLQYSTPATTHLAHAA